MKKQIALSIVLAIAASSVLMAGTVDSSKEVTTTQAPPENPWSFTLALEGWMTGVNGTISAGDRSADIDIAFKDILKHLDMGYFITAEVRYKRWGLTGDLIYARLSDDIDPPRGLLFSSTHEVLKETIGTIELSYRVVDSKTTFLDVFAGARIYDFNTQIVLRPRLAQGVNAGGTVDWVDPIFGLRGRYYVSRAWYLNLYGDVGGFGAGSQLTWQVLGGVGVQVSHWCDVELGYRALYFDYESGRAKQEITTHGPIIGAVIHF